MPARKLTPAKFFPLLLLALFCLLLTADKRPASRMLHLPRRTLWAWERPEDLRSIDPADTAIAYLDQTVYISHAGTVARPRVQPLSYPNGTTLIPVVRIEAAPDARFDSTVEEQTVALLLRSATRPDIAAFQIDFDATRSQRGFYRDVLRKLRKAMPASLPLSITALASWCSYDDWIGTLPVDEAVPMYFRMEPDRSRAWADLPAFRIREPLCMDSIGLSTHEPWPHWLKHQRIYIFADRGWQSDLALLEQRSLP